MGCISPREKEELEIYKIEGSLSAFASSIEKIRNVYFICILPFFLKGFFLSQ